MKGTGGGGGSSTPLIKRRVVAAIRGAFVADAASMGTHWIYDPTEMIKTVISQQKPEFRNPPSPKYYSGEEFPGHYDTMGKLSPYGEQLLFVTQHVADTVASTSDINGPEMSVAMLEWAKTFGGRPDGALKTFVENMEEKDKKWPDCGSADDNQAHIYMKIVPVVGRYVGSDALMNRVIQTIQVHQNNSQAIAFGIASARLLEAVLLGAPLKDALKTVEENVGEDILQAGIDSTIKDQVLEAFARGSAAGQQEGVTTLDSILLEVSHEMMKGKEDSPFYNLAGRSCALPGSFIGPIALFYKLAVSTTTTPGNAAPGEVYASAIRENILASGDTCSRSVFIGAVLAAAGTVDDDDTAESSSSIPTDWIDKMDQDTLKQIDTAIESIVGAIK